MKPLTYFVLLVMTISPSATFAQYQLVGKDGDRSALYFNTKLDNVQGVIYTSLFENFASPQKIRAPDITLKGKGELYSSLAVLLRLRCEDKSISTVDGQKFLNQNMQGGMVAYEKPLSEREVTWAPLETKYFEQEPYRSMIKKCNL